MNVIGRYQNVRAWNGCRLSVPYIIDRKWSRLLPIVSGGTGWKAAHSPLCLMWEPSATASFGPTTANINLSNNYVAGTSGNAAAARFIWPAAMTITDIYFFIVSYTGTASAVTDINWEVRSGTATTVTTTAGALVASGSVNPSSATGWIQAATGQTISLSAATYYWIIIGDANGNATNFATVQARYVSWPNQSGISGGFSIGSTTANGFIANSLFATTTGLICKFSDGTMLGQPFTGLTNPSSSTNRKGWFFSAGLNASMTVFGLISGIGNANISGSELYYGSTTTPGTSPTTPTQTLITDSGGTVTGSLYAPSAVIPAFTPTRLVFTYSGSINRPQKVSIGTGADATLRLAGPCLGTLYWAEANGTTNWSNDDINAIPSGALLIDDQGIAPTPAILE